jgi:hypothetical protein
MLCALFALCHCLPQRRLCRRGAHLAAHEEPNVNAKPPTRTRTHTRPSVQSVPEIRYTRSTCFFCRQAGQPVQPVILTLTATELTPAHMPEQIEVAAYACVDEEMCRRVAAGWCVHREAVGRVQ